jgi:RHS repeat-associated protein
LLEERSLATAPATVRDYAWIEEEPVGTVDTGPQPTQFAWVHTDRLGTPLAVTSSPATGSAHTIWRASYEPFGLATVNADPDGDLSAFSLDLRFPGQRWDAESGAHDNYFRTYDPSVGRYLEADPIGQKGGLNLYTYVENDPPNQVDPLGLTSFRCQKPLDRLGGPTPGSGTRSGPDFPSNPLYHQYICVATPAGITCGGQTAVGGDPWGEGLPSDDHFDPNRCEPTGPPDNCMDQCLLAAFTGKRPRYGLFGPYTNCQEWSNDALSLCERICVISHDLDPTAEAVFSRA